MRAKPRKQKKVASGEAASSRTIGPVIERLGAWFIVLQEELAAATNRVVADGDRASVRYLQVLEAVLVEHRAAFDVYCNQSQAPERLRLQWLQTVGAGLALVDSTLGRIDGSLPPNSTPLVAAFSRLLGQLLKDQSAVFLPERFFNYEIVQFHAEQFEPALGDRVSKYEWPLMLIRLPTGILESPRNHILVGHELGHAIAAVDRAEIKRCDRELKIAQRNNLPLPPLHAPLLPRPAPTMQQLRDITIAMLRTDFPGVKVPSLKRRKQKVGGEDFIFLQQFASAARFLKIVVESWLEELFADAIGVCLFGPAYVLTFIDVLFPTGAPERASQDHPPIATRVLQMDALLRRKELGGMYQALPVPLTARIKPIVKIAKAASLEIPGAGWTEHERALFLLAQRTIASSVNEVHNIAIRHCREANVLYTGAQLKVDMERYLLRFVRDGVPPIGDVAVAGGGLTLATILNVGQAVALAYLDGFRKDERRERKERDVDALITKAIELMEFQVAWASV